MKSGIYAIYDRVAEECGPVWAAKSDAVAVRNCRNVLKDSRADEFMLYCLGSFDSEAIVVVGLEKARQVVLSNDPESTAGTAVQSQGIVRQAGTSRPGKEVAHG